MSSFPKRCIDGEHEQVWAELTTLGGQLREKPYCDDALAVLQEDLSAI